MAAPAEHAGHAPRNEIIRSDGKTWEGEGSAPIAPKYASNFLKDGNAWRSSRFPDKIEFIDRKDTMHTFGKPNDFTVRAMVETAKERGWESLQVKGANPKWKSMVYIEATSRGIDVKGYQPTTFDKEALERRQLRSEAHQNPVVQAFLGAETAKQQQAAVKKFPQLADAFAVRQGLQAHIKATGLGQDDQKSLIGKANDKIARAIHLDKELPKLEVRTKVDINEVERD